MNTPIPFIWKTLSLISVWNCKHVYIILHRFNFMYHSNTARERELHSLPLLKIYPFDLLRLKGLVGMPWFFLLLVFPFRTLATCNSWGRKITQIIKIGCLYLSNKTYFEIVITACMVWFWIWDMPVKGIVGAVCVSNSQLAHMFLRHQYKSAGWQEYVACLRHEMS